MSVSLAYNRIVLLLDNFKTLWPDVTLIFMCEDYIKTQSGIACHVSGTSFEKLKPTICVCTTVTYIIDGYIGLCNMGH